MQNCKKLLRLANFIMKKCLLLDLFIAKGIDIFENMMQNCKKILRIANFPLKNCCLLDLFINFAKDIHIV